MMLATHWFGGKQTMLENTVDQTVGTRLLHLQGDKTTNETDTEINRKNMLGLT
jgi:hypothetical protein